MTTTRDVVRSGERRAFGGAVTVYERATRQCRDGVGLADRHHVTADQNPALTLDKTASPSTYDAVNDVISYSYLVSNTGTSSLVNVIVSDDAGTAGDTSDDFPAVAKRLNGFVIGDTDQDNVLDPGETWLFTSAGVVTTSAAVGAATTWIRGAFF